MTSFLVLLLSLVALAQDTGGGAGDGVVKNPDTPSEDDGGGAGNGGGGWACAVVDPVTKLSSFQWMQLLDLREAEKRWKLHLHFRETPVTEKGSKDEQATSADQVMEYAMERLLEADPEFYAEFLKRFLKATVRHSTTDKADQLMTVKDMGPITKPKPETCPCGTVQWLQIGNFTNDGFLTIYSPMLQEKVITPLQWGAFFLHEAMQLTLREIEPDDGKFGRAIRGRRLLGLLLSDLPVEKIRAEFKLKRAPKAKSAPKAAPKSTPKAASKQK